MKDVLMLYGIFCKKAAGGGGGGGGSLTIPGKIQISYHFG